jgi:sialate O-acetylesterase
MMPKQLPVTKLSLYAPLLLALASPTLLHAEATLPAILSSHMVLQREQPIHIWGWAQPGEVVSAELNGSSQSATTNATGHWSIYLAPQKAGGPFPLTVKASNTIVLDDVLVGDVWFASGQSNMEMPLNGFPGNAVVTNAAEEIRNANHPDIRLLFVPHRASEYPQVDYEKTAWTACTPETAAKFSAVAYFFGRAISQEQHVPIGLIDATWGGTPGEAWMSLDGLSADPGLMPVFSVWADFSRNQAETARLRSIEQAEDDAAKKAGQEPPKHPWHPDPASWAPAKLYNGMVAPAVNFRIKGVIWYQGETNSASNRAHMYQRVFSSLIADWRRAWAEGNFPFLYVQISSFTTSELWGVLREAQRRTLDVANTGMAVTLDIGDPDNVHPSNKQDVGGRLALAARALAYGEQIEFSGPIYRQSAVEGNAMRVWFNHTAKGLAAKGGALDGFEIAGSDHRFVSAAAQIDGDTVLVSCGNVSNPRYVRYAWANAPAANLFNGEDLPASTFTSEPEVQ